MTGDRRVLITGSRRWPMMAAYMVRATLEYERLQVPPEGVLTVVHGACPQGADLFAHNYSQCVHYPPGMVIEEPHPADWNRQCDSNCYHPVMWRDDEPYCPRAGFVRNEEMAALGADICHAFIAGKSNGTYDCARRAAAHGIPVMEHIVDLADYE